MRSELKVSGCKAQNFHDRLDSHVRNRSMEWEMDASTNLDVAMDAEYVREHLAPVRLWLESRKSAAVAAGWSKERVRQTWDSPDFRKWVRTFRNAFGRHGVLCAYLLLINDVLDLGVEAEIRQLMDAREPELSEEALEIREAIERLRTLEWDAAMQLPVEDVLAKVNEIRRRQRLPPRTSITAGLRDLDFSTKRQDWITAKKNWAGPHRGKAVILPFEHVRGWDSEGEGRKGSKGSTPH